MRVEQLDLLAFGPFSGTRLDFSASPEALQLVYGPNEAGKSTTLRALLALLYGIPERTTDAHLHEMGKLRLAARLRGTDGTILSIVRRKGRKQTLLDERERPIDEGVLRTMLGGLDEGLYRQMFGLDHERLRLGAEALLQGGGGLGEGLFDAGTGAQSIHAALTSLREEADALYRPKGQRKLNLALNALRDRQREGKEAVLSPQAFEEQTRALKDAEAAREEKRRDQAALLEEQARLELGLRALPLLLRRDQLDAQLAELGEVVPVAAEALMRAQKLEHERTQLAAEVARLTAQRNEVLRVHGALPPEESAPSLEHARELLERLGNQRTAERELPRLRGELSFVLRDLASIRARMGQAMQGAAQLDASRRARLRKVAEELRGLDAELARAQTEESAVDAQLTQAQARLAALGESRSLDALRALLHDESHIQRKATLTRLLAQLERQKRSLQHGLAQLDLQHAPEVLSRLALPGQAEVEVVHGALDALARRRAQLHDKAQEVAQQQTVLTREVALLSAEGEPATEEDLLEARSVRERFWHTLAADLRAGTPPVAPERLRAFEAAQRACDRVADRMLRETGRAGLLAQERARLLGLENEQARIAAEDRELMREELELRARFVALWQPTGLATRAPADALAARERLRTLVALAEEVEQTTAEHDGLRAAQDAFIAELTLELKSTFGMDVTNVNANALVSHAEACLARELVCEADRKVASSEHRAAERARDLQRSQRESLLKRVDQLRAELDPELAALGLDPQLSAHETLACLDELLQLEARDRDRETLARNIESLEAESSAFTRDVHEAAHHHLPQAANAPLSELVFMLNERAQRARDLSRDRERVAQELGSHTALLSGAQSKLDSYEHTLHALLVSLSVPDLTTLVERDVKQTRARELLEAKSKVDADLLMLGEGASLKELVALSRETVPAVARARLHEISAGRELLDEQIRDADQEIGRVSAGLERLRASHGASESAEEVEAALSHAQGLVRRFVEVRLALSILTREVERYRDAHQGPVLARATVLFPLLTLGRYRGLDVDYADDDTPRLCAVRDDKVRVHVDGLSDGTRDQLYLALRIASMERFIARNQALPIVLDDILLHFDDARSEASLRVLGELSVRTQVVFFTHHARIVELAQRVLPKTQLHVHTLRDPRAASAMARDDGPLFSRL